MRTVLGFVMILAAVMLLYGTAVADERAEFADLQARIATLEAQLMAPAGAGDAESLTSLQKKGQVRLGGVAEIDVIVAHLDEANSSEDNIDITSAQITDADLDIRGDGGTDTYLFMKLDLDDASTDEQGLVEELQFVWQNVRGSKWTLVFGKDEVWFGQDKDMLVLDPYVHGGSGSTTVLGSSSPYESEIVWSSPADSNRDAWNSNPHEPSLISGLVWPGEVDNRVGLQALYQFTDQVSMSASLFQNVGGLTEDRSRDHGVQSWATQLKVKPIEGLQMQASFINLHDEAYADIDELDSRHLDILSSLADSVSYGWLSQRAYNNILRILDARVSAGLMTSDEYDNLMAAFPRTDDDIKAVSVGADFTTSDNKWEIWGEYLYGWDLAHLQDLTSHVLQVGAAYAITEKINLISEFGLMVIDNETLDRYSSGLDFDESLWSASLGASYTFDNGIKLLLQYMHEWYKNDLDGWENADADILAFRTAWEF
ncbi:MAG: hypothetical protein V1918_11005 [Planctomycetota bacterium]